MQAHDRVVQAPNLHVRNDQRPVCPCCILFIRGDSGFGKVIDGSLRVINNNYVYEKLYKMPLFIR